MDTSSGDVVAIKQISLSGVSHENLQGVMGEIDLLKTLNHRHIVKYIGSFKTRSHLYIILEFMENGALSSVIKPNRFGDIAQVLQGLAYLHDQGVVHRDIKGANILTTKEVRQGREQVDVVQEKAGQADVVQEEAGQGAGGCCAGRGRAGSRLMLRRKRRRREQVDVEQLEAGVGAGG